jgi:hypothetical protein
MTNKGQALQRSIAGLMSINFGWKEEIRHCLEGISEVELY